MLPFWFAPHPPRAAGEPASRGPGIKRPFVQGRKVDPSAVPPTFGNAALWPTSRALALVARLPPIGAALYRWRSAPEPTGEPWKLAVWSGGSRVHSLSSPLQLAPTAGSLRRRREVLVPITARIRMWAGVYGRAGGCVKSGAGEAPARLCSGLARRGGAGPHSGHLPTRVARDEALGPLSCQLPTRVARGRTWGDVDRGHKPIRPRSSLTRPFQGRRAASRRDSCATRVAISWA